MKDVLEEHEWGRKKRWRGQEGRKTAPPSPISDPANLPQLPRESAHLLWTPSPHHSLTPALSRLDWEHLGP